MMRVLGAIKSSDRRSVEENHSLPTFRTVGALRSALIALALSAILLLVLLTARAQAETPVTVHPAEVSTALFVAGDVARLSKVPGGTEDVVLEKALQQLYADEPSLAPATAEGYIGEMKALLAATSAPSQASLQLMSGNQRIVAILATLERSSGALQPAAKLAVTHLAAMALSGASDIFADAESPMYFEPEADSRTNLTYTTFSPATVLRATRELAAVNRPFGEARDALWAAASEESVFSEWKELLSESKYVLDSEALKTLREAVETGHGSITEEPAQLTALFTQGQQTTQEQSCEHNGHTEEEIGGKSISGIPRLKCSGGALDEASKARSCGNKTQCENALKEVESHAQKQAKAIAEERAVMIAAAELLRPSDNTAATLQQATAQAQAQITEEETAYATYEAEKAQKEAIANGVKTGLEGGTAVLAIATGNYSEGISGLIGVGFELYEHTEEGLSNPPPGPQEITLQDLADISTQLAGFQQYTQEAFHALNTQLAQLTSQLARENYELKEELGELGEKLEKEQGTIFALQDQVKELFAAQTKADLQTTIEDSVGWLRRTGEPLSGPKVQESLVALKKYATEIANGALVNNAETQPYTFEGADLQLTSKTTGEPAELSEDITYLGRFPEEQGWVSGAAPASLANTTFWSESARAYAQLLLENASHATVPDIDGLKALEKEGVTLENAAAAWSASSAGAKTGNAILDEALANFEKQAGGEGVDGASSINELLEEAAEKYLTHNLITGSPSSGNPTSLHLWGGPEQSFTASQVGAAKYPALKWEECGGVGKNPTGLMPESFTASLPAAFVDGVRLGVIGAPGSGDPLILKACRTITKTNSVASTTHANRYEEDCSVDVGNDCRVFYEAEAKQEKEAETVNETLTLQEGEGGSTLAAPSVGECKQTSLFWKGKGYDESWDPTTEGAYGDWDSTSYFGGEFEERNVGSIDSLSFEGSNTLHWTHSDAAIEGTSCPGEGTEEKAGVEYADYSASEKALGSAEPTIVKDVDKKLREIQEGAYGEGLSTLKNLPAENPSLSLAGARALVQSYVKLGFPQAVDSDPVLEGDVEGLGAQFLDPEAGTTGSPRPLPEQLTNLVGSWIKRLKSATEPEVAQLVKENLIGEVAERSSKWAGEITEQLKPYVEGKVPGFTESGSEAVGESSPLVESTLNRLQLTRDVLAESRAPSAETLTPSSDIGTTEATVRGEVDPDGGVVESCIFEYGSTEYYGHSVACSAIPGAAEKAVVVSAKIADWTPEGSFHERVVVKTWGGTSYGEDVKVQLAQSAQASPGLVIASTDTPKATIGTFAAEELPPGVELPSGVRQIVGSLKFTVNVTPGGSATVKIELPSGSEPTALYKLVHIAGGGEEYREVPTSLYTITANMIELTLVDGGPDDEDGEVNGVIHDPLVPAVGTPQAPSPPATTPTATITPSPAVAFAPPTATIASPAGGGVYTVGAKVATKFDCAEGVGGPGIASCVDSSGASGGAGKLDTAKSGMYTYTVTAKSRDGQSSRDSFQYTVVAPHECVSHREVAMHVADHVSLPAGATLVSSRILLKGRVVAKLSGPAEVAVVNFAGRRKGPYAVTLVAKLSNGETRKVAIVFHTCTVAPKPASGKR
jgi:hypothetical protein